MTDQDISALEALLAEMEAEDAERHAAMAFLRRKLGRTSGENGGAVVSGFAPSVTVSSSGSRDPSVPGKIRPDEFFRMSIPAAITRYLGIVKQPQGPKAISDAIVAGGLLTNAKNFYTTLYTAIKRMEDSGQLVNTPNGWGLAEWYPGRSSKGSDDSKKAKRKKQAKRKFGVKKAVPSNNGSAPGGAAKAGSYRQFVGEALKAGKTMAQAAAEWRQKKVP